MVQLAPLYPSQYESFGRAQYLRLVPARYRSATIKSDYQIDMYIYIRRERGQCSRELQIDCFDVLSAQRYL
jgi:hypothetical protein